MDAELRAAMTLAELGLSPADKETALDAVLRLAREADVILRPYRYQAHDGLYDAFNLWWKHWVLRPVFTLPGGYVSAEIFNTFQAGYTARGEKDNG